MTLLQVSSNWHPLMDSNHRMAESKSAALPTWRRGYKLEERVRFELTVLRICNPLHWAALPPFHTSIIIQLICCVVNWWPQQESNLHTPAYLAGALVRYKLTSLPLSYGAKNSRLACTLAFPIRQST